METPNRKFGEWGQFDRYCKLVLYHEAIDYLREMQRRRDMEISLDELSPGQIVEAAQFATAAASITVSRRGSIPALPVLEEIQAVLTKKEA